MLKLFKRKHELTVTDILRIQEATVQIKSIAGRTFQTMWCVADRDKGYKVIADGFETREACREYVQTCGFNYYSYPYIKEIK